MSDSDSSSSVSSTSSSSLSHAADSGAGGSDVTWSSQPDLLAVIPFNPAPDAADSRIPSATRLPSRKFQFSVWNDLRSMEIHGPQLKAPRVRRGPAEKEKSFYLMVDEDNNKLHHDLHGRQRQRHRDTLEDWEKAKLANFPYQDLHHGYQDPNTERILDRLRDVTFLNLRDNALLDLSSYSFPRCEYLNLDCNYLVSFKNLPGLKKVRHLTMMDNDIARFAGLSRLHHLPLDELFLMGNPISFQMGYRQKVFAALPQLKFLDGVAMQEEDLEPPPPDQSQSSCVIL